MLSDRPPVEQMTQLAAKLEATRGGLELQDCYFRGAVPFHLNEQRYAEVYRRLQREARPKWGKLIVTAAAQRLNVEGFLTSGDPEPSDDTWDAFVASGLDLMQNEVHLEALTHGRAYVSVWPQLDGSVRACPESPWETVHWRSPDRSQMVVGKIWGEDDAWHARLFTSDTVYAWAARRDVIIDETLPDSVALARGDRSIAHSGQMPTNTAVWVEDGPPMPNPFAPDLPFVPFVAGAHMADTLGRSELESAFDIIDRIMSLQLDLLLVSRVMGFPVRWATGVESPVDANGKPVQTFTSQIERFLTTDNPEARFGQLAAADLRQIAQTIQDVVIELAAVTETPSSVLQSSNLANPASAEALRAQEIPLVHRVVRHQREFAVPWIHVARLLTGATEPMEVMWADAEVHSEAALTDALVKQVAGLGVPREAAWEELPGATPTTIARWRAMAASQAIEDRIAASFDAALANGATSTAANPAAPAGIDQANIANPSNPSVVIDMPEGTS